MIRIILIEAAEPPSTVPTLSALYLPAVPAIGDVIPAKRLGGSIVRYERAHAPAVFYGTTVGIEVFELDPEAPPHPWFCPWVEDLSNLTGVDEATAAGMRRP